MALVVHEVTRRKLDREIELWHENVDSYRRRGWLMLGRRGLELDIAFLARLPLGALEVPIIAACVRFDFTNYDLWPPSVEFIDPLTGDFSSPPVPAVVPTDEGPRNLLIGGHPDTDRPFLCIAGTRQYHNHPQHSGDSWLLHRAHKEGSLGAVCDRIWRSMVRSLFGLQLTVVTLPPEAPQRVQVQFQLVAGDVDSLRVAATPADVDQDPTAGEAA